MTDDMISRQAAIDVLLIGKEFMNRALDEMDIVGDEREQYEWGLGLIESYIDDVEQLPSAQPEIIRCKECKFYDGRPCGIVDWYNTADDFCSRAERKEK